MVLRLPRSLMAVLGSALALALAPAAADAAAPGINIAGAPTPDRVSAALATGAKQIRVFVSWDAFEPASPGDFPNTTNVGTTDLGNVYRMAVDQMNAAGAQPIFVVWRTPNWANGAHGPYAGPSDPNAYGGFVADFTTRMTAGGGKVAAIEVWNEPDDAPNWANPSPGAYTNVLRSAYAAVKQVDPTVTVLTGATTGNNYDWIQALYASGAKGSFDAVAVHTDTACLVKGPDFYYRDATSKRIGRFAFLGYREVRQTMLANGDDKPIWMTELGWSSATSTCQRGDGSGKRPAGVGKEDQARFLTQAYGCLAADPYVVSAAWFTLVDDPAAHVDELRHYGLNGKPAAAAFADVVRTGGGPARECGDFGGPAINVVSPVEGQKYTDTLALRAKAVDSAGVGRISYYVDGVKIRNFTEKDALKAGSVGLDPWFGSRKLSLGRHVIKVEAIDMTGNASSKEITVERVAPGQAGPATLTPGFELSRRALRCTGRSCTLKGALRKPAGAKDFVAGKVSVEWQVKNKKGKWRKIIGGLKTAAKPFSFAARPRYAGRWRVRVLYTGVAPYKSAKSKFVYFRIR